MCGNLPSAVICLKSTLSVFVPLYSLFAMTRDASRRKVKWGNHSRLKKTEKETSIHFQRFINNCIIPPPQGFFIFFGHSVGYTNPRDFCLIFSSHIVCQKNLSYKKWWNVIQTYCDWKQTYRPELIKHGTPAIVWMRDIWDRPQGLSIHFNGGTDN